MNSQSRTYPRLKRFALTAECLLTAALMTLGLVALGREGSLSFADKAATLRLLAVLVTAAALLLCGLALGRNRRPQSSGELPVRSLLSLLAIAQAIAFLCVLFGSRHNGLARFYLHIGGVAILGHAAMLSPEAVGRGLAWLNRYRGYRFAERLGLQLVIVLVLTELSLRGVQVAQGGRFVPDFSDPFRNKLTAPHFGDEPNPRGYNDRAFTTEREPGTIRLAAVGDSFFVAHVPRPLGVISRTEQELRAASLPVEVYNFGIVAIDIAGYRRVLEEALEFQPDLVLLGIYVGNDIRVQTPEASLFNRRYFALYHGLKQTARAWEAHRLEQSGDFVDLTREPARRRDWTAETPPTVNSRARYLDVARRRLPFFLDPAPAIVDRAWRDSLRSLQAIIDRCREASVPLVVVLQPDHIQIDDLTFLELCRARGIDPATLDRDRPQRRLSAFLRERNVPVIDLLQDFRDAASKLGANKLYLGNDTHWSVAGNARAARALAPKLKALVSRTGAR